MRDTRAGERRRTHSPGAELPWPAGAPLFASGTDAIAALLRWGAAEHGWSRVWLPSYYCPEVPAALRAFVAGVEVHAYPDHDLWAAPNPIAGVVAGDVVVLANQLGVRRRPAIDQLARNGVVLVDDHSHDLGSDWARDSGADYAFASLRKTLPIPDGGVVWSPRGRDLPPEPTAMAGGNTTADRLARAIERRGRLAERAPGERLVLRAAARIAAAPASARPGATRIALPPGSSRRPGISPVSRALLAQMPVRAWRERRRANFETLTRAVGTAAHVHILAAPAGGVAFALTLVFDSAAARARVRDALVAHAVVPTVLWPLDPVRDPGTGDADADLAGRILSVNADQRFREGDMVALAPILREALRSA